MNFFLARAPNRDHVAIFPHRAISWNNICKHSRGWVITLILFCVAVVAHGQNSEDFIKIIPNAEEAVIPVACATWPDSAGQVDIQEIKGTGLFVSFEGHFITAAHVLEGNFQWRKDGQPTGKCFPVIYLPYPGWEKVRWFEFRDCAIDSSIDVAVCRTRINPFGFSGVHPARLHLNASEPAHGTDVAFTGFPQFIPSPITSRGHIASIGEFAKPFNDSRRYILVDKTNWHGVSGGPLYLSNGDVIGIMTKAGEGIWEGMGFAILSGPILTFLRDHQIPVLTDKTDQHPESQKAHVPKK